jgi:3-phenylpropionate/trans-cinnamate dioxygenase ferredoxin component
VSSFTRACALDDLPEEGVLATVVDGEPVAVVRSGGEVFAIHDVCSHAEVPLSDGEVGDCEIECWLHGSRFDLRTGKPTGPPASAPVPVYPVRVDGGDVLVDVDNPRNDEVE